MNIVLYNPEIPPNTGNIARTCAVTNTKLHLIKPLGFDIDEKSVRRAGLDYWNLLNIKVYENFSEFIKKTKPEKLVLVTTKANKYYSEMKYDEDHFLVFGSETKGLPQEIHDMYIDQRVKIPMISSDNARSLNLSNSVNIILYEALRQNEFRNLGEKNGNN